jgi:prolyl-tRNA synthetase
MGHIFQLGRKFSDSLGLQVLDESGRLVTPTMGSYGIGVSRAVAEQLVGELERAGVGVLYDDRRGVSPGVKFADSELLGVPTIVVVGRRLVDGVVELKDRRTGSRTDVPLADAVSAVLAEVSPPPV